MQYKNRIRQTQNENHILNSFVFFFFSFSFIQRFYSETQDVLHVHVHKSKQIGAHLMLVIESDNREPPKRHKDSF